MPDSIYDLSPTFLKLLDPEVIDFIAFFESLKNGQGDIEPTKAKEMGVGRNEILGGPATLQKEKRGGKHDE